MEGADFPPPPQPPPPLFAASPLVVKEKDGAPVGKQRALDFARVEIKMLMSFVLFPLLLRITRRRT